MMNAFGLVVPDSSSTSPPPPPSSVSVTLVSVPLDGSLTILNASNITITLGNAGGDSVSATFGDHNTITLGNGAGDSVNISHNFSTLVTMGDCNGASVISGQGNNNTIVLGHGAGDQVTLGDTGDSVMLGNGAGDMVTSIGGNHNTIILGNGNGDVVDDRFGSNNTISVGFGNDTIHIGLNDTVTVSHTGTGPNAFGLVTSVSNHDTFIFDQTDPVGGPVGSVTINHFDPNSDTIQLNATLYDAMTLTEHNGSAVLADSQGDSITVTDVQASALHSNNFLIV
jgi:hypothetical protein